ncbi:hypothetical protein Arub01_17030 [Actinomadura rubrobrunea]|uniref:Uncharacterized protein n=1 Tax=Actinomadura rubrobrunea TaxID=115335 RepID=A0A9W6PUS8_9ACTN|nr:phage holin family protein [Actinomadura rubrobrunea]GLW63459.1 hypothetical protein Arub01_17030 [Actinomadura rubrobrunea]
MVKQASPEVLERSMEMTRDVAEAAQREIWEKAQRRLPAVQMGMVAGTLGALATAASYRLTLLLLEKKLPPEAAAAVAAAAYGGGAGCAAMLAARRWRGHPVPLPTETARRVAEVLADAAGGED